MNRENAHRLLHRIKAALSAAAAVVIMSIALYAAPLLGPGQPYLSPMQALAPSAALGGEFPITDAQGLVNKKVFHLELRGIQISESYSVVFYPKTRESVSITFSMKGAFKISFAPNAEPRIVINGDGVQTPLENIENTQNPAPCDLPDGAVALTFPAQNTNDQKPCVFSGPVNIHLGKGKAYRAWLPIKSAKDIYIGARQLPLPISRILLIQHGPSARRIRVVIPDEKESGIPAILRVIAFFIAAFLAIKADLKTPFSIGASLVIGVALLIFGIVIFHLSLNQEEASGSMVGLCGVIILLFVFLKNPAPVYPMIALPAGISFFTDLPPVIGSTFCLAAAALTMTDAFRLRKELQKAQILLPVLLILAIAGIEFHLQTRGQPTDRIIPITGTRLDTWAIRSHTDILNNHENLGGEEFRGRYFPHQKNPGALRIVALGSSSTYGAGIGDPRRTWPARLEDILRQSCNPKAEVINAGWGGYNAFQLAVWIKEVLWRYEPDAVILYYGGNEDGDSRPENFHRKIRSEIDKLENPDEASIVRALTYGTGRSSTLVMMDKLSGLATYRELRKRLIRAPALRIDADNANIDISDSLKIMFDAARDHHFQLVLVPEINARGGEKPVITMKPDVTRKMKDFAEANGIEFYDLTSGWEKVKNEGVAFDFVHLTPLGCGYLAGFIADRLKENPVFKSKCAEGNLTMPAGGQITQDITP